MPIEQAQLQREERVGALRLALQTLALPATGLTLEIGCGHGHFLTAYAAAHRSERCVAIDIIAERLHRAERKTRRAGLANVTWLRADADDLLEAWPEGTRFDRNIFILFPDPWPKRRHWKNRLIRPAFLDRLATRTAPGAAVCFRTDHAPYFAAAAAHFAAHPDWQIEPEAPWPFEHRTVFEARADAHQSLVAHRR